MDEPRLSTLPTARVLIARLALALALASSMALAGPAAFAADAADAVGATDASGVEALQPGLAGQVRQLALAGSRRAPAGVSRVEVSLGQLDPRLRLAPCQRIEPYLPAGTVLWGKTRIGLRCTQGPSAWNVFLPIRVGVFGQAWVALAALPAGSVIAAGDLTQAEVNLAEEPSLAITDTQLALGRALARALGAGQALRQSDLKARQWFAAGDEVRLLASGSGFSVSGSGQALNHGLEGQPVRVRIESGRVVVGMPVGERQVELPL